jgi:periplasmic protein TonB
MKIIILALIISISLHFLAFYNYGNKEFNEKKNKDEIIEKKSDVKFVKLKKKEIIEEVKNTSEIEKKQEIKKTEEIKNEKKETAKNEVKKGETKKIEKKADVKKQIDVNQSKEFQEKILKDQIVKKDDSLQNSILENFLSQKEPINKEILGELEKLYGEEYQTFTKVQKAYLEKNLNNFQVITQRVLTRLGYPPLAAKLKIGGANVVEFMFHPDGSITNLKITNSSGYEVFDKYSLELIEIAYKDYPRPTTSTKLKFNVRYQLY